MPQPCHAHPKHLLQACLSSPQHPSAAAGIPTHPSIQRTSRRTLMLSVVTSTPATSSTAAFTAAVVSAAVSHASLTCIDRREGKWSVSDAGARHLAARLASRVEKHQRQRHSRVEKPC